MARTAFLSKKTIKKPSPTKKEIPKTVKPIMPIKKETIKKHIPTKTARKHSMSVKTPTIVSTPSKKPKVRRKSAVMSQIKYFQNYTNMLVSKLPFSRLVREIMQKLSKNAQSFRFTRTALLALQEAFEAFIVTTFEDAKLCSMHAKRITLFEKDINLVNRLTKKDCIMYNLFISKNI